MPIRLYRRGNSQTWHYRGSVKGERLRGSTGTSIKADAQKFIASLEHREWQRGRSGPNEALTFAEALVSYAKAGKRHVGLDILLKHWGETPVAEIKPRMIREAGPFLYPNAKPSTWNRQVITPTQAVINHAAEQELCQRIKVSRFKSEKPLKEPATWEWIETFMQSASPTLGALALFMLLTGARIGEAISLDWQSLNLSASAAVISSPKTKTTRRAHLPPVLVAALANLPRKSDRVFGYDSAERARYDWRKTVKHAGIKPPLLPHSCRHGFATALLRSGVDVITVAKLGGWASPQHVFQTYGHASDDATITDRIVGTNLTQTDVNPLKRKA